MSFALPSLRTKYFCLIALGLACADAFAAAPATDDRVVAAVDASQRVTLGTRRPTWVSPANDAGAVPDDLALDRLSIVLKRSDARQRAFEQFLADQQNPSSSEYHHWLSPSEVGARFGATQHDIDAISSWLSAQGLHVDGVSNGRTRIRFGGTASTVGAAFATPLRYYRAGAEQRIANASDMAIPAAFSDAIAAVIGVQSVRLKPALHISAPMASVAASPRPADTYCPGGSQPCQYTVFPADFSVIYDLDPLYQRNIDGSGQTIAVVGRSRVYEPDVQNFQSISGVSGTPVVTIVPPDGLDPGTPFSTCPDPSSTTCGNASDQQGDQNEATLDVQRAGSVAPGATIDLIASKNTSSDDGINIAIDYAVNHEPVPAKILSISFTSCEADNSRDVAVSLDDFFGQAAAEGISVFVASGDAGVAGCASLDAPPDSGEPKSTNILCASQYVTCVGGTEFADANHSAYWRSTDGDNYVSAIGYIPEGAWNEPLDDNGHPQLAASGGGFSTYLPTPAWQHGVGVPGSQGRYTPDVSLHASTDEGYFTCMAAQNASCVISNHMFSFIEAGGTSASTPGLAGIAALLDQSTGSAQGNLNPRLYSLAADAAAAAFHDVTVSSSGVSGCTLAVPSMCNNTTPGPSGLSGGLVGYEVGTGYDEVTGLGSVDAANLVDHWNAGSSGVNLDQVGLTGSWYNPVTSGQGLVIQVVPDLYGSGLGLIFGGWFTFDVTAAGGQRWYTVQGQVSATNGSVTMPIYVSEGGNFDAPPSVGADPVGQATLSFGDCAHGTLTYAFSDGSGRSGSIPLQRLNGEVACTSDGNVVSPPAYLESGAWYEPSEGGQGLLFDINPSTHSMFAAWYTYATNGQQIGGGASQRWYTLQATYNAGTGRIDNAAIYATTGGVFDTAGHVSTAPVGSANIVFTGCTSATLTYQFDPGTNDGRGGTLSLGRLAPALSGCSP